MLWVGDDAKKIMGPNVAKTNAIGVMKGMAPQSNLKRPPLANVRW